MVKASISPKLLIICRGFKYIGFNLYKWGVYTYILQNSMHGKVAGWLTCFNWIGCGMQHEVG